MSSPAAALDKARSGLDEQATGLLGVGVDLVDVGSFRELLESGEAAFVGTVWTETEQRDAEGSPETSRGALGCEGSCDEGAGPRAWRHRPT